jgi:hypothetical protein
MSERSERIAPMPSDARPPLMSNKTVAALRMSAGVRSNHAQVALNRRNDEGRPCSHHP